MTAAKCIYNDVLETVGNTPCIRLNHVPQAHGVKCEMVAKCEYFNPGGSVKDRIGKQMILDAEAEGRLTKGSKIVEATSGNTGIGLSLAAAVRGYDMTITMPKKMSNEKEATLNALGAKVIRTETSLPYDHPESLIGVARRMAKEEGYVLLDQYKNESNPEAHYKYTGQEIWDQCEGKVDMVVLTTGTGGTMTGVARKLKEMNPNVIVVGVDPIGSILADPENSTVGSYHVEGIGYDFVPDVCHRDLVDRWIKTNDQESFDLARELHKKEGLLVGGSSGSALAGAIKAAKDLQPGQRCVVLFADGIRNYLAKFADDNWMKENGFMQGPVTRPSYDHLAKELEEVKARLAKYEKAS